MSGSGNPRRHLTNLILLSMIWWCNTQTSPHSQSHSAVWPRPVIREHWNMDSEHGWDGLGWYIGNWGWGWGSRMEEPVSMLPVCWQTKMSEIFFQLFLIGACSQACSNDRRQKSKIYSVLILPEMSSRSIPRLSGCQIARTNGQTDGHIRTHTDSDIDACLCNRKLIIQLLGPIF